MDLKKIINDFFVDFFDLNITFKKQLDECRVENTEQKKSRKVLESNVKILLDENKKLKKNISVKNSKNYVGKLSNAKITYKRELLSTGNVLKINRIDVRNFITPNNFFIFDEIKKHNLFVVDPYNLVELDSKVVELYKLAKKNYKYTSDKKNFGLGEVWLFPFESFFLDGIDCEDWSHIIGSFFACAGVPRNRWWVTCGRTRLHGGHSTIYVKDSDDQWRHLNSTAQKIDGDRLQDYPKNSDKHDYIGLESYWFSFNDFFSVVDFENEKISEKVLAKKIKILGGENGV